MTVSGFGGFGGFGESQEIMSQTQPDTPFTKTPRRNGNRTVQRIIPTTAKTVLEACLVEKSDDGAVRIHGVSVTNVRKFTVGILFR